MKLKVSAAEPSPRSERRLNATVTDSQRFPPAGVCSVTRQPPPGGAGSVGGVRRPDGVSARRL